MGMPALAVTDHEGLYGAVRFYQACKAAGIKPIVGVELTVEPAAGSTKPAGPRGPMPAARVAPLQATTMSRARWAAFKARARRPGRGSRGDLEGHRRRARKERSDPPRPLPRPQRPSSRRPSRPTATSSRLKGAATVPPAAARAAGAGGHHLVLLARDYAGWSNLCRIITAAHLEHPGEAPVARLATLAEHSGHLVALSGCRRGEVWSRLLAGDRTGAARGGGRLSRHLRPPLLHRAAARAAAGLGRLAARPRPAGPRAAPPHRGHQRRPLHGQGRRPACTTCSPRRPPTSRCPTRWGARTPSSTSRARPRCAASSSATRRRTPTPPASPQRCDLDLGLGRLLFPAYPLPPGETAFSLLWKRCFEGAERALPAAHRRRSRRGWSASSRVIEELGFAEYFLVVHDIVEFARSRGIYYSGRGSAGNSIVSYVLRITDADPIAHDLLFERFLNPARREMPDIDIDFCSARRDEVIQYIYERFGHDKVAMVATVNTMHAPSAVRIVAAPSASRRTRSTASPGTSRGAAPPSSGRCWPSAPSSPTTSSSTRTTAGWSTSPSGSPASPPTWARTWAGSSSRATRSPTACRCSGRPRASSWPSSTRTTSRRWAWSRWTSWPSRCTRPSPRPCAASRRAPASTSSACELPRDDPEVYEIIQSARTVGLFQLESSGQRNLATRLQERDFEDVIAAISLFRPGPLQAEMIAPFIRRRHGREPVVVPHPAMERILRRTYGVIVYQEQVLEVAAAVAGFSLAEADMLRRAMTHERSMEEMDEIGRNFVEKAVARGVDAGRGRRGLPPAARVRRLRLQQGARRLLRRRLLRQRPGSRRTTRPSSTAGILNNQPMGFYSPRVVLNDARRFGLRGAPARRQPAAASGSRWRTTARRCAWDWPTSRR